MREREGEYERERERECVYGFGQSLSSSLAPAFCVVFMFVYMGNYVYVQRPSPCNRPCSNTHIKLQETFYSTYIIWVWKRNTPVKSYVVDPRHGFHTQETFWQKPHLRSSYGDACHWFTLAMHAASTLPSLNQGFTARSSAVHNDLKAWGSPARKRATSKYKLLGISREAVVAG
jgi:hypothetical protein